MWTDDFNVAPENDQSYSIMFSEYSFHVYKSIQFFIILSYHVVLLLHTLEDTFDLKFKRICRSFKYDTTSIGNSIYDPDSRTTFHNVQRSF